VNPLRRKRVKNKYQVEREGKTISFKNERLTASEHIVTQSGHVRFGNNEVRRKKLRKEAN